MAITADEHNQRIQSEFTKQADAYATNPTISDPDWALRLVTATRPAPTDRVLELATGPGYVALAFARFAHEVVGIDLTEAPLALAQKKQQEQGLKNLRFEKADATGLPFDPATFEITVCRLAFHHFLDPQQVLREMVRVTTPGGKIVVEDLVASEHPERAAYHNRWERLRDPSHTTALSITQLLTLFREAGLEIIHLHSEDRPQVVDQWLRNAQTPPAQAEQTRRLLEADEQNHLSGLRLFRNPKGQLCFDHRMVTMIGHNL